MKVFKTIYKALIILMVFSACTDEDSLEFINSIEAPKNVLASYNIAQDNTGLVTITPSAEGANSFKIHLGDGTVTPVELKAGENVEHIYTEGTYQIKVEAFNIKGDKTEVTQELVVSFKAPENLVVTLENDQTISKQVNITATADFATMFEFYSGEDGVAQPVATANIGETINYQYTTAGSYNVKVIAKGAAIATSEHIETFEVTAIVQPINSAPTPPGRKPENVISIYSSAYTNVAGTDTFPDWGQGGQGSSWTEFDLAGDKMLQYVNLSYQGIQIGSRQDVSSMEYLHLDVWTADVDQLETSLINVTSTTPSVTTEKPVVRDLIKDNWVSIDIPISDYVSQGLTVNEIFQLKFVGIPWATGTVFIDNIYFYKTSSVSTFNNGLLTNGDFESGSDSWIIGVDDSSPAPVVTKSGNTHYSVNVTAAGNPWDVNVSQKVEIIQGNTYTLTFDAWSDQDRTIIAGIGLSGDPWTNKVETVNINSTRTTYSLTLSAADFGAANARVIFDSGADIGMVNIDNVSLIIGTGNILTNGDFENGSDSWIIGVDDSSPAPVITNSGNTHYSVNVTAAGNPWDVNVSQKVEIIQGNTYTLTFDAWSDQDRTVIAGIGLSGDPWTNKVETVNINSTRTTYSLTLSAADFGAANARVIFDSGADVGIVNIDNVTLSSN